MESVADVYVLPVTYVFVSSFNDDTSTLNGENPVFPLKSSVTVEALYVPPVTKVSVSILDRSTVNVLSPSFLPNSNVVPFNVAPVTKPSVSPDILKSTPSFLPSVIIFVVVDACRYICKQQI